MQAHKAEEIKTLKITLREEGRERTYSNGDSDRVDLEKLTLFFVTSPTVGSAWETDEVWKQRLREKSEEKRRLGVL